VRDLGALTASDFEPFIGTDFEVFGLQVAGAERQGAAAPPVLVIRLVEVQLLTERHGYRHPFALHFTGPDSPVLAHQVHRLGHAEVGELELFLGPVTSDAPGITYEAVFT
jgi:hypothetical protein